MEDIKDNTNEIKDRHGCVTTWLVLMIIVNSMTAILYFFANDLITQNLQGDVSNTMIILLGLLGVGNVIFAAMLLKWRKIGFWGFLITSIGTLFINIIIGLGIGQSLFGLIGIGVLYGVLQIKKNNISAWENLE